MIGMLIQLVIVAAWLAGMWKAFEKMGRKGWEGIVPIYNFWLLAQTCAKPVLWFVMCIIPFVNIIPMIDVAKGWGKGTGFGVGLALLGFVFWPMLGFTDAKWNLASVGSTQLPVNVPTT
jgi:hypothetical protein